MKRVLLLAICSITCNAQTLMNIGSRKTQSLDGQWKTIIDPYGHGNWAQYSKDEPFTGRNCRITTLILNQN